MTEIASILQADTPEGSSQVIVFIPSKDLVGQEIDQAYWVDESLSVIGRLFRGANMMSKNEQANHLTKLLKPDVIVKLDKKVTQPFDLLQLQHELNQTLRQRLEKQ
jgi:hypothetical protein